VIRAAAAVRTRLEEQPYADAHDHATTSSAQAAASEAGHPPTPAAAAISTWARPFYTACATGTKIDVHGAEVPVTKHSGCVPAPITATIEFVL
jgi:hypothetical protein